MLVMMVRGYALVALAMLGGCAQLFGLDETTAPATPTDGPNDAPIDGPPVDARVCAGGDARVTDPMTGNCYVLFTTPATRNTARTMCQTLGTGVRLASVQSAAENQVIANLIGARLFFAGHREFVGRVRTGRFWRLFSGFSFALLLASVALSLLLLSRPGR